MADGLAGLVDETSLSLQYVYERNKEKEEMRGDIHLVTFLHLYTCTTSVTQEKSNWTAVISAVTTTHQILMFLGLPASTWGYKHSSPPVIKFYFKINIMS